MPQWEGRLLARPRGLRTLEGTPGGSGKGSSHRPGVGGEGGAVTGPSRCRPPRLARPKGRAWQRKELCLSRWLSRSCSPCGNQGQRLSPTYTWGRAEALPSQLLLRLQATPCPDRMGRWCSARPAHLFAVLEEVEAQGQLLIGRTILLIPAMVTLTSSTQVPASFMHLQTDSSGSLLAPCLAPQ